MSWIIAGLMYRYWRTNDEVVTRAARLWIRIFALTFAVGVASGIALEFQFGANWAAYSRFVGDIFGAPLAAEVVFTFFLESTFLAMLVLGWGRLSRGVHFLSAVLVAVGATLSAFWILVANSWMQTPAGYTMVNGRPELASFAAAVFNPSTLPRFLHTVDACLMTGAFFVLGLSAILLLRRRQREVARLSFNIALLVAFAASVLQLGAGHFHAVQVAQTQPEKLAAFEGLYVTQAHAPLLIFGIPDPAARTVHYAIKIPGMLSWLATGDPRAVVRGLNDFGDDIPPIALTFYPFHLMVAFGLYFIGVTLLGLFLWWRNALHDNRLFLRLAIVTLPLPLLTNELGWIAAEVGRQPWIVYRLMRTADAVSITVPPAQIAISLGAFAVVYSVLLAAWIAFIRRELHREPAPESITPQPEVSA
ncbi:MAG TPA: cytochrome ubiquinol oxidase subunit I [Armatimonadota bacterium]|nr:cytochrome ubiquinol oxidase subunit I [Armatimonadota bacterium]